MPRQFSQHELEAYLDEALSPEEMAEVEQELRGRPELVGVLAGINRRRDAGVHSLGEIWRRNRVGCPTREQLGSHLLGVLEEEVADYVHFHVEQVGCRLCQANLADLKAQQDETAETTTVRRKKFFQSSAGYLQK